MHLDMTFLNAETGGGGLHNWRELGKFQTRDLKSVEFFRLDLGKVRTWGRILKVETVLQPAKFFILELESLATFWVDDYKCTTDVKIFIAEIWILLRVKRIFEFGARVHFFENGVEFSRSVILVFQCCSCISKISNVGFNVFSV